VTQHYLFAHRILSGLLQSDADGFRAALLKEGSGLLQRLWIHAGQHGKPSPGGQPTFSVHQINPTQEALLIQLPPPQEPPEAYFVALLNGTVYTLELGRDLGGDAPCTYLCSWSDTSHANLGQGPAPEREAFLQELAKKV
jgi:hypothetical protein